MRQDRKEIEDIRKIISSFRDDITRFEKLSNKIRKAEEYEALSRLINNYSTAVKMLECVELLITH